MKRSRIVLAALTLTLLAPTADRLPGNPGALHAEEKYLQYYRLILNDICTGDCIQGPYCCQIILKPAPQG
ncbi:MAG TPA: hypothetical protein VF746_02960 [Longimicrobium sp.]|jgi:hypothetical protein